MTTLWTRRGILAAGSAVSVGASAIGHSESETPQAAPKTPVDLEGAIGRERQRILERLKKDNIPGTAVCLIYKGAPVWVEGFGVTDDKSKRPVNSRTIFSVQSTSKNFTTTAIMVSSRPFTPAHNAPISPDLPSPAGSSSCRPSRRCRPGPAPIIARA